MTLQSPVIKRPLQMFGIEFVATLVLVFFAGTSFGFQMLLYPLIAGGAAGAAGLFVGLLEQSMLGAQAPSGPTLGAGARAKKKEKPEKPEKKEKEAEPAQPPVSVRPVFQAPAPTTASTPVPAASSAGTPSTRDAAPAAASATPAGPQTGEDRLPPWMERAMAQASHAAFAEEGASTAGRPTEEELRAQLEQPVSMAMPVKAPAPADSGQQVDQLDQLLSVSSPATPSAGQMPHERTAARPQPASQRAGAAIRAAVVHPDRDQRRHIASVLAGVGLDVAFEADSEQAALLGLLDHNVDVVVTALDVGSSPPAEYVEKIRKACQFAVIVAYGVGDVSDLREVACAWPEGAPLPADLARMLGL